MEQESAPQKELSVPKVGNIRDTQDCISREIQRQAVCRIDALHWEQTPQDLATRIRRLVLFQGGEKSIFSFTEYELRENHGSQQQERQMQDPISDVLIEL